mmetsp:Transcript_20475/g.25114  ORF Transcript_20475/g.25114 Transcript_20475/m.25114 type:complete len:410 (+) Transcript_20475:132-1361(+)
MINYQEQQRHYWSQNCREIRLLFVITVAIVWSVSFVTYMKSGYSFWSKSNHQFRTSSYSLDHRRLRIDEVFADPRTVNVKMEMPIQTEIFRSTKRIKTNLVWDNLLDIDEVDEVHTYGNNDIAVPFFWHIHKTGGTTMKTLFSQCLDLVVASQRGGQTVNKKNVSPEKLEKIKIGKATFLNAEVNTIEGIEIAHSALNFSHQAPLLLEKDDNLAIMSAQIRKATELLFDSDGQSSFRGILFALFRHPVEREISNFHYLKKATWEKSYDPSFANLSLDEFIKGGHVPGNWMVRNLIGKSVVDGSDLNNAKWILRNKCWIGLQHEYYDSVLRFGHVFGWDNNEHNNFGRWNSCMGKLKKGQFIKNTNTHSAYDEKSDEWRYLLQINSLDMELYVYALQLYQEQKDKYFSHL